MSRIDTGQLITRIFSVSRVMFERIHSGSRPSAGASFLQAATLKFIAAMDGPTMKQTAAFLRVKPPSATSIIDGLIRDGLVTRRSDGRDRRSVRLALTARGRAELTRCFRAKAALLRRVLRPLSAAERAQLASILEKLSRN